MKTSQENALQEAQKIQSQFRTLVTKTGELAEKGHAGAKMVMEGLQRQGMGMAGPALRPRDNSRKRSRKGRSKTRQIVFSKPFS